MLKPTYNWKLLIKASAHEEYKPVASVTSTLHKNMCDILDFLQMTDRRFWGFMVVDENGNDVDFQKLRDVEE